MQTVSIDYINELNKQFIGGMTAEVDILNVNIDKQNEFTINSFTNMTYNYFSVGPLFEIREIRTNEIATFELNHTRANGLYDTPTSPYTMLLGTALSSTTPLSNGEYPLNTETGLSIGISYYSWDISRTPLTFYLGENTGSVRFVFSGTSTYTTIVRADNGWIVLDDVPLGQSYNTLNITFTTLLKPQQRARIYRIFFGTALYVTGNELTGLTYNDYNDCTMLELPSRSATITVSNLNGEYDQEKEYENPSFVKHHTQILLRVGQEIGRGLTEWMSLGRYFLSDYSVNSQEVKFNAISALGLLNEYPHQNWGRLESTLAYSRFWEITGSYSDPNSPETAYLRFDIQANFYSDAALSLNCANAPPAMPMAQAMQILSCWIGACIYIDRGQTGIFASDITVNERKEDVARSISSDLILNRIEWSADKTINKIDVIAHVRTANTTQATLNTDPAATTNYVYITATSPIATIPGGYEEKRAYSALVNTYGGEETDFPVTLYNMDSYSNLITVSDGNGETIIVDNPLMSNNDGVTARAFAEKLYSELKYNVTAQFSHRGFPELDCGDVITIETQPGVFAKARVIENNLTINQGSVSGSTKVRRLS